MSGALHPVVRLAPAKLNLTLAVLGVRPDGFHDLHSVMVRLGLADRLSLARAGSQRDSLHVVGGPDGRTTLDPTAFGSVLAGISEARRAVGRGADTFPLAVRLEKRIPVAAGLAGGSSDAAAAIDGALEAWGAELDAEDRRRAAAATGSDVPFFLAGGAALIQGRGERVTPLAGVTGAPPAVLLVTPAAEASTRRVFAAFDTDPAATPPNRGSTRLSSEHLAAELSTGHPPMRAAGLVSRAGVLAVANDLANAADLVVPGLRTLRRALTRLLGVPIGMSGSGPTLWALYPALDDAEAAAGRVIDSLRLGLLYSPGSGAPFVTATTIESQLAREGAMTRRAISTAAAPSAVGPYSQAIATDELVFCSGQVGLDPATGALVEGGLEAQADRALRNLAAVLDAAGCTFADVVKTTCFLIDINDFAAFNAVYGRFMPDPPPARSTFAVAALPKAASIEIEAIALRPK